jgi:hypothetical protein
MSELNKTPKEENKNIPMKILSIWNMIIKYVELISKKTNFISENKTMSFLFFIGLFWIYKQIKK